MSQITILAQVLQRLPRDPFKKLVKKYSSDKHSKGISSWDHLVSMLFCHLAGASSLRDISYGLRSTLGNRSHLGLSRVPSKSSLSYINSNRNWQLFRDFYFELFDFLSTKGLPKKNGMKNIRRKLLLMDASVIPLCLSMFDWAQYRTKKGGVKLHAVLDYDGLLPTFCDLTEARTHELTVARKQRYPKGSVLVFDKAYTDFGWWKDLDSSKVFFVTRAKNNLNYTFKESRPIPVGYEGVILGDYTIELQSDTAKEAGLKTLRLVRYFDRKEGRVFSFITNQFSWTAEHVAGAYKERWHIEVFFKYLKQHLRIKSFVGTSQNAVMIQIWTALICFLLLKHLQHTAQYKWNLSNLSTFLRLACFAKINLLTWLDHPFEIEKPPPKGQISFEF